MTEYRRVEPDGTKVYKSGKRYTPVPLEERKYQVRKPPDAESRGIVRWRGEWLEQLPVLPEDKRTLPWTRPDSEAIKHHLGCTCHMCRTVGRVRKLKRQRLLKRG